VKGRAPLTGYSRAQFGPAWTDDNSAPLGGNGCDTRNDILQRDLTLVVFKYGDCIVASGVLHDPYSGRTINFVRGPGTSTQVQIDHVVALGDAWQKGAQRLTYQQRVDFANDPGVLLAVSGRLNEQKSDSDAASWLPPNKAFRCPYVARQVAIKTKYRLWITAAEHDAIARVLAICPEQNAPRIGPPIAVIPGGVYRPPAATRKPTTSRAPGRAGAVYFPNCAAVRAAGKAPLYRGEPGYRPGLDRDNDGVACESD
jgi:hypothetical protein